MATGRGRSRPLPSRKRRGRDCERTSPTRAERRLQALRRVTALNGVDFHVSAGEVMALVGDNGAGKSTMIKTIAGIHPLDEGQILWEEEPVSISGPKDSARLGIEVVYQDLALCDNLDVVENMYLGRETLSTFRRLDEAKMEQAAAGVLKDLS